MTTFTPRTKFPLPLKIFVSAGCLTAVFAPLVNLLRNDAWNHDAWVAYLSGIGLMVAISWFLVKEIARQMNVVISDQGLIVARWQLRARWPPLTLRETSVPWSSVRALGKSGFTLIVKTDEGEMTINLFLFEDSQAVEKFALGKWRAAVQSSQQ